MAVVSSLEKVQPLGKIIRWWRDLSVAKKLYGVVGIMATLIAVELLTLSFAMNTLSAVRAFVGGEGLWSKAQKSAVQNLQRYALTQDPKYYTAFKNDLRVPLGDHRARLEMEKPNGDFEEIRAGFLEGRIHPDDIPGVVKLFQRFHDNRYIKEATTQWRQGDQLLTQLIEAGEELHRTIVSGPENWKMIDRVLDRIHEVDTQLTAVEDRFSFALGEGSRWMERLLMMALILAVLTIEGTGLLLTVSFTRNLSLGLRELNDATHEVGKGNFSVRVPVRSRDDLGRLATSINLMAEELKNSIGQRKHAESASQTKSLFLANMSHEIRTPLGAILGFTELLKDPNLSHRQRAEYLEIIERTGRSLSQIINDVIDVSRVESGYLEIEKSHFSISNLIADLHAILSLRAKQKKLKLDFIKKDIKSDVVYTDALRLRQILMNLLGNAIKYTDSGFVSMEYGQNEKGEYYFRVQDSGIGISENEAEELFQPFKQAHHSDQIRSRGSGLGLAVSRSLARALGGDVKLLESEVGHGSTFLLTISAEADKFSEKFEATEYETSNIVEFYPNGLHASLKGLRVLLVEDIIENQMLVQLILEKHGIKVDVADNGKEGIAKALSKKYDIILMDMQMPILDGYAAVEALRNKNYPGPIIALTAHAMKEDRERCFRAGCDDYLTKPIQTPALLRSLTILSSQHQKRGPEEVNPQVP